ncbi:MAG: recombinase RecT [Candidatus Diapherotrites archaeon]|nr:recombinase RecT [Candidatus Diapherotrites archaeon]
MTTDIAVREETPLNELVKMAKFMVEAKLFGIDTEAQAVSLMLLCQAEGLHPAIASRDYHIIQGRHTLKADAMLARFQTSGGKVEWEEYTDTLVSAYFSHPQSPARTLVEWDMKRATQARLTGKDNWKKYPRQMLKARVVSDGVRMCFPSACVGVYTPEEVQDFEPIDVTPKKDNEKGGTQGNNPDPQKKKNDDCSQAKKGDIGKIRNRLKKKDLDDSYITEQLNLSKLENLPAVKVDEALELIENFQGQG